MTFLHQIPWPINVAVLVIGLVLCVLGWRAAARHDRRPTSTWVRRGLMVILVVAMGTTPASIAYVEKVESNIAVYFVVDGTGSMAARDYNGNEMRLDGVKADLLDLADAFPGARYSVIEVTSTSTLQLPLTTDVRALYSWADVFDREYTDYSRGSDVNRPVDEVETILRDAEETRPEDRVVLFYMGDGESTQTRATTSNAIPAFGTWRQYVDDGAVLGYGTEEGGTMAKKPLVGDVDEEALIMDPATGEPAVSKASPANLQTIAQQLGVDYYHRNEPGSIALIVEGIDSEIRDVTDENDEQVYSPIVWPFAIALTLLVMWELWELIPKVRRMGQLRKRVEV